MMPTASRETELSQFVFSVGSRDDLCPLVMSVFELFGTFCDFPRSSKMTPIAKLFALEFAFRCRWRLFF